MLPNSTIRQLNAIKQTVCIGVFIIVCQPLSICFVLLIIINGTGDLLTPKNRLTTFIERIKRLVSIDERRGMLNEWNSQ